MPYDAQPSPKSRHAELVDARWSNGCFVVRDHTKRTFFFNVKG